MGVHDDRKVPPDTENVRMNACIHPHQFRPVFRENLYKFTLPNGHIYQTFLEKNILLHFPALELILYARTTAGLELEHSNGVGVSLRIYLNDMRISPHPGGRKVSKINFGAFCQPANQRPSVSSRPLMAITATSGIS